MNKQKHDPSNDFLSGNLNYLDNVEDVKITQRKRFPFKTVLTLLLIIAGLSGGVLVMLDSANRLVEENATDTSLADAADNVPTQLYACLGNAKTEVEVGDPDFFSKLITSYKGQIDCYNQYDSENPVKVSLEERLNSAELAARDIGANAAEYERRAAIIDEEYHQQMAALDAEAARQEAETQRWLQESAEAAAKNKAESDAQWAQYQAQQNAREEAEARAEQEKIAQCNAYRTLANGRTPQELAEDDAEVRGRYDTWERSKKRSEAARPSNSNVVLNQDQRDRANEKYQNLLNETKNDYFAYTAKLSEKVNYYTNLSLACN